MNGGIQIRIGDLLYAVAKRWKWVLALSFAGLGLGIAFNGLAYIRGKHMNYEITCSAAVTSQSAAGTFTGNSAYLNPNDFYLAQDMVDAAEYVLRSDRLLADAASRAGLLQADPKTIRALLEISRYHDTQILEMTLRWNNGDEGIRLLSGILDAAKVILPETLMVGAVSVIDAPSAVYLMSGSVYSKMWGFLITAGFLMGIGIAVLDLIMRPTLLNLNDVEDILGLETIGTIPRDDWFFQKGRGMLVKDGAKGSPAEQNFASSAYILQNLLGSREENHCLYITSSEDGEGKTSVSASLAIHLSDMGKKVLLLDLDTRNPSLGGLFLDAVDYSHSLNALYKGEATPQEAIISLTGCLDFLPTVLERSAIPMDQALFDFIGSISGNYEYVLIDAPPVGRDSDALSLNRIASAALFVARYDMVTLYEIEKSIEKLDKSGIRILGCIVNGTQSLWDGGFSTGKGQKDKKRGRKSAPLPLTSAAGDQEREKESRKAKQKPAPEAAGRKNRKDGKSKAEDAARARTMRTRNILEELDQAGSSPEWMSELSDEDAVSALLRMGTDGSWKQSGPETAGAYEREESDKTE